MLVKALARGEQYIQGFALYMLTSINSILKTLKVYRLGRQSLF